MIEKGNILKSKIGARENPVILHARTKMRQNSLGRELSAWTVKC